MLQQRAEEGSVFIHLEDDDWSRSGVVSLTRARATQLC